MEDLEVLIWWPSRDQAPSSQPSRWPIRPIPVPGAATATEKALAPVLAPATGRQRAKGAAEMTKTGETAGADS